MPYGLIVDGELKDLGDVKYLLSPQDLMAVEQVLSTIFSFVILVLVSYSLFLELLNLVIM